MAPSRLVGLGGSQDREVVRLGRAAGEDDVGGAPADSPCDAFPRRFDGVIGLPAERVSLARRIPEFLAEIGEHGFEDSVVDRGRRVVIEVDRQAHGGGPFVGVPSRGATWSIPVPLLFGNAVIRAAVIRSAAMLSWWVGPRVVCSGFRRNLWGGPSGKARGQVEDELLVEERAGGETAIESNVEEPSAASRRRVRSKDVRRWILPPIARALVFAMSLPPLWFSRRVGSLLGTLAWFVMRGERRRTERRLAIAFPESMTVVERRRLARRVFQHFGRLLCEVPVFVGWGRMRLREEFKWRGLDVAETQMRRLVDEGNGVIIVVPHIGNWELAGSLGSHGWQTLVIAKRYRVEGYQRLMHECRERLGCNIVYQDDTMMPVVRHLRRGGVLGMLPDLDAKRLSGIFVPFFGRPAYTTDSVAQLSLKFGSPVVVVGCVREGDDYRIEMSSPVRPNSVEGSEYPVREFTLAWLSKVESLIRRYPEQWVWLHDRWHSTEETLAARRDRERARDRAEVAARSS